MSPVTTLGVTLPAGTNFGDHWLDIDPVGPNDTVGAAVTVPAWVTGAEFAGDSGYHYEFQLQVSSGTFAFDGSPQHQS